MGIAQQLDSVPASAIPTIEGARKAKNQVLIEEIGRIPIGGLHIAEAIGRSKARTEKLALFAALWPVALVVFNTSTWVKNTIHSAFVGMFWQDW